ncbi:MAG TPA: PadR family transcriptional regulator [Actinomycetota bacterium]|nr:PadR family transcriptional regulator [Actinomycetota bacterium]
MSRARAQLPPGDFVFLAFLTGGALSAYDIKTLMAQTVSFFWSAAHSQVYQQASRLLRDGYVSEEATVGSRRRRLLALTPKGREALDEWLRAPSPLVQAYDQSLVKLFFGSEVDRADLVGMLEDQRRRHAELLGRYEAILAVLETVDTSPHPPYQLLTTRLGVGVERAWLAWLDETLAALRQ